MHGKIRKKFRMNTYSFATSIIDRVKRQISKKSWIQKMYRKSDAISGVSQSVMRGQNRSEAGVDSAEVKTINNPMDIPYFPSWSRIRCARGTKIAKEYQYQLHECVTYLL